MRTTGFVGLLLALAAGYFIYSAQLGRTSSAGASPQQTIDLTAIRSALFEIGQAQRLYVNAHGAYGTLENGIFIFGLLLIEAMPLLVELGVLLDLFVGVFVISIIIHHINREFASLDTRRLSALKE